MVTTSTTLYRASWVCSVSRPPLANGCVITDQDQIVFVGPFHSGQRQVPTEQIVDLGDGVILPGLINAHTHLEFSDLRQPLGSPGIGFSDWVLRLIDHRKKSTATRPAAIVSGIQESFAAGVWAVGDIATQPTHLEAYLPSSHATAMHSTVFLEQLGRAEQRLADQAVQLNEFLDSVDSLAASESTDRIQPAASSHAPYSVIWPLHHQICDAATKAQVPVAMHLAETTAERQLLDSGTGEFVELLKQLNVWDPNSFRPKRSIKGFLGRLSQAPRGLVVHGNYLEDDELDIVARNKNLTIVYCPRTHQFFDHSPYPLDAMLDRHIDVAVGTDSRASNPDLNLLEELKLIAQQFEHLTTNQILSFATQNAARALGIDDRYGTLEIGRRRALSFVPRPANTTGNIDNWLFSPATECRPVTA